MKKLIFILGMISAVVFSASAQKFNKAQTTAVDTLNGAETVNFASIEINSAYPVITLHALCTEIGGTSDGTIRLQASVDGTSFVTLGDFATLDWIHMFASDSSNVANNGNEFTVTDGGVVAAVIKDPPSN